MDPERGARARRSPPRAASYALQATSQLSGCRMPDNLPRRYSVEHLNPLSAEFAASQFMSASRTKHFSVARTTAHDETLAGYGESKCRSSHRKRASWERQAGNVRRALVDIQVSRIGATGILKRGRRSPCPGTHEAYAWLESTGERSQSQDTSFAPLGKVRYSSFLLRGVFCFRASSCLSLLAPLGPLSLTKECSRPEVAAEAPISSWSYALN